MMRQFRNWLAEVLSLLSQTQVKEVQLKTKEDSLGLALSARITKSD